VTRDAGTMKLLLLLAAGCMASPPMPELPPTHPGSPLAVEAPPPPPTHTLDMALPKASQATKPAMQPMQKMPGDRR